MSNIYFIISLLCIIILNCFLYHNTIGYREGFDANNLNPVKLIDNVLGKLVDALLGSIPILKHIHKKVKKKRGLFAKIKATFYELFISLLTIIFTPLAAIAVLYLVYQLMLFVIMNVHVMFQPNSLLKYIS
mgnify:CR=1 FL=1|uniref:Uncharacterized protein n=1 Tax=viral metagenome TaxID=1070528 RepID=A0A6C0L1W4_9ZZZZ